MQLVPFLRLFAVLFLFVFCTGCGAAQTDNAATAKETKNESQTSVSVDKNVSADELADWATGALETHKLEGHTDYVSSAVFSPNDGRGVNDKRTDGETEYKKPDDVRTWCYFYKHIMQEHLTRQMWSEMTIDKRIPNEQKPGKKIQILP